MKIKKNGFLDMWLRFIILGNPKDTEQDYNLYNLIDFISMFTQMLLYFQIYFWLYNNNLTNNPSFQLASKYTFFLIIFIMSCEILKKVKGKDLKETIKHHGAAADILKEINKTDNK